MFLLSILKQSSALPCNYLHILKDISRFKHGASTVYVDHNGQTLFHKGNLVTTSTRCGVTLVNTGFTLSHCKDTNWRNTSMNDLVTHPKQKVLLPSDAWGLPLGGAQWLEFWNLKQC